MEEAKQAEIGVIVGRFQVHELHPGHYDLINKVFSNHKKVIIFLGTSPLLTTRNNPLDFASRQKMLIKSISADVIVLPIQDTPSDHDWSHNLDSKIREVFPMGDVMLYGGRDSFIKSYYGQFPTTEIGEEIYISGTGIRDQIKRTVGDTKEFRAGVIYGAYNQYPKVYATVDIAILNKPADESQPVQFLLGRKPGQDKFRFVGGFSDPADNSFETSARREAMEETGLELSEMKYIGSFKIDDWRYRSEVDKIITSFFVADIVYGKPTPHDDICELKFFTFKNFDINNLVPEHRILFTKLVERLKI